ncbi:hypothetical protein PSN45_003403 [Yamadazyma tenuis]|uniref:Uncharacterized protein n=1 Tax=Candida tenuis (strain ATCC 10573 / BCRC 21748 / CBS 615 / JCM 9827 / NBRC 10315 / NRRL Y-1498 / VKM Y-70) TaxID=590646 RepID=G3AYA0_CANTC|nr:uncharacterized protein CANTEDRAFT_92135 [Yamadazyma tenuis ATCC 10573]EGV65798.1 hypothetical protein CANTEDRAFT_92135 [Yamadazyma tenuis ATCC 10573]WEJ95872.1 hypothetical protein PSN45_003403 [Yamadazyma tenuis]
MQFIQPSSISPVHYDTSRASVDFLSSPDNASYKDNLFNFNVPIFQIESVHYILLKDLAETWNYPSAYQLMGKLLKNTSMNKQDFLKTNKQLNESLVEGSLIKDVKISYFYVKLDSIYQLVGNKDVFFTDEEEDDIVSESKSFGDFNEDKITVSQVFPSYGFVNSSIDLRHSTFNCLTNLSKYNYYKSVENFRFLPHSKLLPSELENLYNVNDYSKLELNKPDVIVNNIKRRKPLGKPRKNAINIDPNSLELKDTVIPGQGFIQEFNINHVCKVPNYYITNNSQVLTSNSSSSASLLNNLNASFLNLPKKNDSKLARNLSQLAFNNDYENFNYTKYFYTKTYRGPGSGNYKDASLVNRINKIPVHQDFYKVSSKRHLKDSNKKRYKLHLKGLTHEKFNKAYVDHILRGQRKQVEDHENMEMLHNTLQFNLLINTYRDISFDTWSNYFKFKFIDFEQLVESKHDSEESIRQPSTYGGVGSKHLLKRFSLPQDYNEIIRRMPLEFREDIKNPLYFNMKTSESNNSQMLTNIDIIKLPNANIIGWDNLKKYSDNRDT